MQTSIIGDIMDSVQELVDIADRNLTKIFNEPWPPPDNSKRPGEKHQVVCLKQRKPQKLVQPKLRRRMPVVATIAPGSHNRVTWPSATVPAKSLIPTTTKSEPDRRKATVSKDQRKLVRTRPNPPPVLSRPVSAPTVITRERSERDKIALPRPVRVEPRREQSFKLDEIRPDLAQCDVLVIAVAEMEICKEVFAGWRAQLNLADPKRNDKLELAIITTVHKLDIGASAALQASHSILRSYRNLIRFIEQELHTISKSRIGGPLFSSSETSAFASNISAYSKALAEHVKKLQERLRDLVRDIEMTKKSADRRALKRKIWTWLSRAFKALSAVLSAGGAVFALLYPLGLLESAAIAGASMLSGAAAKLCDITHDKYNETTFDEILTFLRSHIPESAKAAEIALTSFQACHRILQVELEVRKGTRTAWVSASEAERVKPHWEAAERRLSGQTRRGIGP